MTNPNQAAIKKYSNSSVAMTDTGTRTTPSSTTTTNTKKDNHDVYHEVKKDTTTSNNTKASNSTTKSDLGTTAQRQEQIQQKSQTSTSNSTNTQSSDAPRIAPPQQVKTTDSSNGVSIKSELESLGLDSAYSQSAANRAEKMDNGQIKITYYGGAMECYYDVDENGHLTPVYGVAYDENKNKVYEEQNGVVLKEYNPLSNNTNSSINITEQRGSEIENIKAQMAANSKAWHTASPEEQKKLHEKNIELSKQLEDIGAQFNAKTGVWSDSTGQNIYIKNYASSNNTQNTSSQVKDTKYWEKYYGNNYTNNAVNITGYTNQTSKTGSGYIPNFRDVDNYKPNTSNNSNTPTNSASNTLSQTKNLDYWKKYYGNNYANNAIEENAVLTAENATQMPTKIAEELVELGISSKAAAEAAKNAQVENGQIVIPFYNNTMIFRYNIDENGKMVPASGIGYETDENGNIITDNSNQPVIKYEYKDGKSYYYTNSEESGRQVKSYITYLNNGSYKETIFNDDGTTTNTYNKDNEILFTNIIRDDNSKISYNYTNGVVSDCNVYDQNGNRIVSIKNDDTYKEVNGIIYFLDKTGELSIYSASNLETAKNDSDLNYIQNSKNDIIVFNQDNTISHMTESEARAAGIIKSYSDFTQRTYFGSEDYNRYLNDSRNETNDIGSCVWYVVGRTNEVYDEKGIDASWSYHGYGGDWYAADPSPYGRSNNINDIRPGAVLSYSPNHVVYVESVNSDGTANISEANVGTGNTAGFRYSEGVSLNDLENLYGKTFNGMVFTLPE